MKKQHKHIENLKTDIHIEDETEIEKICNDFDIDCISMSNKQHWECYLNPSEYDDCFSTCPMI